jgi:hypothetical protein
VNKGEFDSFFLVNVVEMYQDVCLFVGYGNFVLCWCGMNYWKPCSRDLLNKKMQHYCVWIIHNVV